METESLGKVETLQRIPLFRDLLPEVLEELAQSMESRSFKAGDSIVQQNAKGEEMFVISSGGVEVLLGAGTYHERVACTLRTGEFFGEMSLLDQTERSATVKCAVDTEVFVLTRVTVDELRDNRPDQFRYLILNIARELSRRLRAMDDALADAADIKVRAVNGVLE